MLRVEWGAARPAGSDGVLRVADGDMRWAWLVLPWAFCACACLALWLSGGDLWWADRLYALEGGRWVLREARWAEDVVHRGGRVASLLLWLAVALAAAWPRRMGLPVAWRAPLARLALSVLVSVLLVAWLKRATHVDCPWDLARYGGGAEYLLPWAPLPPGHVVHACFPAGHAGSAYAWVAVYFFLSEVKPAWRVPGLALVLAGGALFGIVQQLRGAHFLSHDIASLAVCWQVACAFHCGRGVVSRRGGAA